MRLGFLVLPSCSCSAVVSGVKPKEAQPCVALRCGERSRTKRSRTEPVEGLNYSIPRSLLTYAAINSFSQQKTVSGSTCKSNEL